MPQRSGIAAPSRAALMGCPVVLFDCDGVILDSNDVKTDGFRQAVDSYANPVVDAFLEYHRQNGGLSRYEKFEYFFRDLVGLSDYRAKMEEALERFAYSTKNALLDCPLIPGVTDLLKQLNAAGVPCFVVSGSDQHELRDVLRERRLDRHFRDILGSPASKLANVKAVLGGLAGLPVSGAVMFGDAIIDMETAEKCSLTPVFVSARSQWADGPAVCQKRGWAQIADFGSLA
ncbi:MAG: HAD family hydrolase [Rhodospirillaceae bacterium]|nr:HAD family hydrolase [Rhodospirillaceae bacterium]